MAAINKRKVLESAQKNLQKGAVDKALKDYQTLLDADPRDANVRLKVGDLKLRLGKADEAITAYLKVADQFTRDGFDAKAVAIYKQVSKLDAKRYDVYIPLADLYQRLGLSSEAMVALQTAAEAYQRDGRKREALDLLRRMASLDATNTTSRLKVADLLLQEGLEAEALVEFSEAAAELERQGDWEARAGVLQRIVELAPDHVESYDALITLWLERRQARRAESFARKLLGIDPERAESHELLARILTDLGDETGAIDSFRKAADAWIARGMEDRARAILQRHIPSEPFDFGGTTDPLELGGVAAPDVESPFGEEGIGGEPLAVHDEFAFAGDESLLADEPPPPAAKPVAPAKVAAPVAKVSAPQPTPRVAPEPKPVVAAAAPVLPEAPPVVHERPTPTPVQAPVAAPSAVASAPPESSADSEQLLAEAGVYLRYGKRERAVASLEVLLAREPEHLAALELLGEAHAAAEDPERAVEVWMRAAHAAAAASDATRLASLRSRIEAIDALAAMDLPEAVEPPRAAAAATMLFETAEPVAADANTAIDSDALADAPATRDDSEALEDIEIDIDGVELDDAASEPTPDGAQTIGFDADAELPPASEPAAVASEAAPAIAREEMEIEIDSTAFDATPSADSAEPAADESVEIESTQLVAPEPAGETAPLDEPEIPEHFEEALASSDTSAVRFEEPAPIALDDELELEPESEQDPEPELEPEPQLELDPELDQEIDPEAEPEPEPEAPPELELEPPAPTLLAPQPEQQPDPVLEAAAAPGEFSSTTSAEITEDLEEAAFYFEQGLLDEAESIYQRVVQRAPNHPAALLRLGEIAVARGQDSAIPVTDVAQEPDELASASEAADTTAHDIEPPDDLDLTAREFGPNTWQDDAAPGEADAAATDAPPELVQAEGVTAADVAADTALLALDATMPAPSVELPPIEQPIEEPAAIEPPVAESAPEPAPTLESVDSVESDTPVEPELTAPDVSIAEDAGAPAFDLAAELSEALVDGAPATRAGASTDEDGFSSLFSEFKRGVSRTLGEGDVETHFDLGIAYREMGLLEDAIGEFHYALGSTARRMDALHMMGLCALDMGRAVDAIGHLEQALASPDVPAEREAALRFDLGRAHEGQGDRDRALDAFRRVAELEPGFQDVGARIEALLHGSVATDDADATDEAYESFDDLIAEAAESSPAVVEEPVAPVTYENFDEFLADDDAETPETGSAVESVEVADTAEPEANAVAAEADSEAVVATSEVVAEIEESQPPDAEPEPPAGAPRRRKVSFF